MRQGRQRAARSQWQARRWQWQARREPGRQGRQRSATEARKGGKGTAKGGKGSQWQRAAREAAKGTASAVSSEAVWKGPQGKRQRKRQAQPRLSLAQSSRRRALSRSLAPRRALLSPQPKPKPTSSRALDELFSASTALLGCMESQCESQNEQVAHLLPRTAAPTQRRELFFGRLCVLA